MHSTTHASARPFGVAYLQAVRRGLPQLLLATIAAGLATYLAQSWIAPRYAAEARIEVAGVEPGSSADAHVRALKDPIRLFSVATELRLQDRPDFNGADQGSTLLGQLGISGRHPLQGLENADERLLAAVYERFAVAPAGDGTVAVRLTSTDPQLAARFVNRLVEAYLAGLGAKSAGAAPADGAHVTVWAEAPLRPQSPRRGPMAMLGMAVMLILGLGGIATREAYHATAARRPRRTAPRERAAGEERSISGGAPRIGMESLAAAAGRLLALPAADRGCRIMVAGEAPDIDATAEALALTQDLSHAGRQVVLVRWSPAGGGTAAGEGPSGCAGLNDLLEGQANFEQVVTRLPGSRAHAIAAGSPVRDRCAQPDPDVLGLVLDTLDEVYDHIVVLADHLDARRLFAALDGRFDACVSVGEARRPAGALEADVDLFLGFEVTDIHIMRLERLRRPSAATAGTPVLRLRTA
ncbi:MAG: hypothetical protein KJZ80_11680 [Hyphomicrobiaceae bacterium]|nr:hypothetical protein [Hyphomicrobiaceae bacterium]